MNPIILHQFSKRKTSEITYTLYSGLVYSGYPCSLSSLTYDIYEGSDMQYYAEQGGTYVLASSISGTWYSYSYSYNDGFQDRYVYDVYDAINGGFVKKPIPDDTTCAPF